MDDLIQKAQNGDEHSMNHLIKVFTPNIEALLRPMVDDASMADIAQDVWLSVFTHLKDLKNTSYFKTWLYRIVINQAKSELKSAWIKNKSSQSCDELESMFKPSGSWKKPPVPWGMESPDKIMEQEELAQLIKAQVDNLPIQQRTIMILHDMELVKISDISEMLEISENYTSVMLHRARKTIYHHINQYFKNN